MTTLRRIAAVNLLVSSVSLLLAQFAPLTISPSSLPYGASGSSYSVQLSANGSGSYQWSLSQGSLPPGLSLGPASGTISGTATAGGSFPFTVMVMDTQTQQTASRAYTVGILYITNSSPLPGGDEAVQYSVSLNSADGPPAATAVTSGWSYTWSIDRLPPGLQLNGNVLSGRPTASGVFNFNVTVTATPPPGTVALPGLSTAKAFSLTIGPILTITTAATLPNGSTGTAYRQTISVVGGTPPYSFSLANGPPFLSIDPGTGVLSGTPTTAQMDSFTVTVSDASVDASTGRPPFTTKTFQLTIASSTPEVTATPPSLAFTGAVGGDSPPAQVIVALPAGVSTAGFQVVIDSGQAGSAAPAWLSATPAGGNTPARLVVRVDQGSMAAGNYSGRIRLIDSSNNPTDVPVTLTLTSAAPQLDAAPQVLHFAARIQAPGTLEQIIVVRNSGGGGPVSFNASVVGASPWISSVTPSAGQTGHNSPGISTPKC